MPEKVPWHKQVGKPLLFIIQIPPFSQRNVEQEFSDVVTSDNASVDVSWPGAVEKEVLWFALSSVVLLATKVDSVVELVELVVVETGIVQFIPVHSGVQTQLYPVGIVMHVPLFSQGCQM